MTPNSFFQGL